MENYIIANKTDVGRTRQVNEDSMITFDSPNGRVVAVCDGMGGQAAGDVASQLACSIIRDILENNTFASPLETITRSMMAANQGILHRTAQEPELEGMGTTCVMLIIKEGVVYYGWVGDSRIYYISNHTIRQISKDQSYVQSLVDSGQISQEEAAHHPQKNEITNALGLQGMTPPVLCQLPITPEPGSVFLLCSDGLTGMVDNAQIERVVSKSELTLHEKAERLVELANQNGGLDNITVQLVEFQRDGKGGAFSDAGKGRGKKGGLLMYIAAALLVIVLAVAAFFLFFNKGKDKKDVKPDNTEVKDDRTKQPQKEVQPKESKEVNTYSPTVKEEKKTTPKTTEKKTTNPKDNIIGKGNKSGNSDITEKITDKSDDNESESNAQELYRKGKGKDGTVPEKDMSGEKNDVYEP